MRPSAFCPCTFPIAAVVAALVAAVWQRRSRAPVDRRQHRRREDGRCVLRVLAVEQGTGQAVQTDDRGRFELRGVPAGTRRLFVSVVGYALVQRDVVVAAGGALDVTIPLRKGPAPTRRPAV